MAKKAKKGRPDRMAARRQFLALQPQRNPKIEWQEHEGRAVLTIPRGQDWKTKLLNIFFPLPESRDVILDGIGSEVWRMSDGQMTIGDMTGRLAQKYKLGSREAELSLQQFFKDLGRRGYIGFRVEKATSK